LESEILLKRVLFFIPGEAEGSAHIIKNCRFFGFSQLLSLSWRATAKRGRDMAYKDLPVLGEMTY